MADRGMGKIHDLIEEAKSRTILCAIFVVGLAYCLSLTSNSVWLNIPISILIISVLRYVSFEVELRRRRDPNHQLSYISHLQQRQLSPNDPLLLSPQVPVKWKRRFDSPIIAAAVDELSQRIVQEFVTDLWYSAITPDQEVPDQIRLLINDVLAEIYQRVKHVNLVDLLTRDMIDLIGSHLELYRRSQAYIGVDVMDILSSEERDERLKHCLAVANELHPALVSADAECKILQRLMGGVVAVVLRPHDVQCTLVRCLAREILACGVMQPIMNFASPVCINELIEFLMLSSKEEASKKEMDKNESANVTNGKTVKAVLPQSALKYGPVSSLESMKLETRAFTKDTNVVESGNCGKRGSRSSNYDGYSDHQMKLVRNPQLPSGDWTQLMESGTPKRAEVLTPEIVENLWAKGWNYREKESDIGQSKPGPLLKLPVPLKDRYTMLKEQQHTKTHESIQCGNPGNTPVPSIFNTVEDRKGNTEKINYMPICELVQSTSHTEYKDANYDKSLPQMAHRPLVQRDYKNQEESGSYKTQRVKAQHRRSKSGDTAFESRQKLDVSYFPEDRGGWNPETLQALKGSLGQIHLTADNPSLSVWPQTGNTRIPKLECWVLGVHFEKVGFKSFAVYSIAVTNLENKTWFVDRRYRNFEQLHRRLRDIPNYTLHLPPKRFISSSLDDFFIRQRCILLDKYLKDLLSIPNIAEQHEVWDFLSATSKNYSFQKTPSVMKTLAFNVDDAMVDLVRQFKGVSGGSQHKFPTSYPSDEIPSAQKGLCTNLLWTSETAIASDSNWGSMNRSHILSDDERGVGKSGYKDIHSHAQTDGWQSDSELHVEYFGSQANLNATGNTMSSLLGKSQQSGKTFEREGSDGCSTADSLTGSDTIEDEVGIPPEWTPPNLTVPLLKLVDKIFQLHRRGWLRRQVFWIAKQIVQLLMEDAIDDWLLSQIHWLKRDDAVASGIKWVQNVLWPNGISVSKSDSEQEADSASNYCPRDGSDTKRMVQSSIPPPPSFEQQLQAARRANLVHDILIGRAPASLVSLVGTSQYNRCAKDIYFFLQSTVCMKQLAYSLLELLLITAFPELHDLVCETHNYT